jgi:type I restriction enzyme M protein
MSALRSVPDPLSRFYTKETASRALVSLMRDTAPKQVLDLGSGAGALSHAARIRWKNAEITSVDIDHFADEHRRLLPQLRRGGGHRHIIADVLSPNRRHQ